MTFKLCALKLGHLRINQYSNNKNFQCTGSLLTKNRVFIAERVNFGTHSPNIGLNQQEVNSSRMETRSIVNQWLNKNVNEMTAPLNQLSGKEETEAIRQKNMLQVATRLTEICNQWIKSIREETENFSKHSLKRSWTAGEGLESINYWRRIRDWCNLSLKIQSRKVGQSSYAISE